MSKRTITDSFVTSSAPVVVNGQLSKLQRSLRARDSTKNAIAENLERLEWFGVLLCHTDAAGKNTWQFTDSSTQVA